MTIILPASPLAQVSEPKVLILSIQFLRALAALMVLALHVSHVVNVYGGYVFPYPYTGAAGVDIFFVISGFVITYITRTGPVSPLDFLARRLIRVAPVYWFYTTITLVIVILIPGSSALNEFGAWHAVLSYLFVLSKNNDGEVGTLLGMGWTVCYEMYFYMLFAAMLATPRRFAIFGISCIIILGAFLEHLVVAPAFALVAVSALPLEFLAGCLLAKLYIRGWFLPAVPALAAMALGCVLIYWAGALSLVASERDPWRVIFFGLPGVFLVAGFLSLDARGLIKFPRFTIAIGDASYSLYLSHQFVLYALGKGWGALGLQDTLSAASLFGVGMIVPILAAILAYRWLERPLTRWLNASWQRRTPVVAAAG